MNNRCVLGVLMLSMVSAPSFSLQVDIKPGLWEHTMVFDESSIKAMQKDQQRNLDKQLETMKKHMAELPPEQRAQLEEIAKQQGGDVNLIGSAALGQALELIAKPQVSRECLTQEQLDKGLFSSVREGCRNQVKQTGNNKFKVVADCQDSHSEIDITVQNPKLYTGAAVFASHELGSPKVVKAALTHRWLASDCGHIKPDEDDEEQTEAEESLELE